MECGPCFSGHTFPSDWNNSTNIQKQEDYASDSEASITDGPNSASDDDTASEAEAIPLLDLMTKDTRARDDP